LSHVQGGHCCFVHSVHCLTTIVLPGRKSFRKMAWLYCVEPVRCFGQGVLHCRRLIRYCVSSIQVHCFAAAVNCAVHVPEVTGAAGRWSADGQLLFRMSRCGAAPLPETVTVGLQLLFHGCACRCLCFLQPVGFAGR